MKQRSNTSRQGEESYLFLLRLWADDGANGQRRWHGRVQNIVHGEARNFAEWPALIDCLQSMLPGVETGQPPVVEGDGQR